MEAGALGIGSSLIYAPDTYAARRTDRDVQRSGKYQGKYISHIRTRRRLIERRELLASVARPEFRRDYHLKASNREKLGKMDRVIAMVTPRAAMA